MYAFGISIMEEYFHWLVKELPGFISGKEEGCRHS
jgi:hypothetical protein